MITRSINKDQHEYAWRSLVVFDLYRLFVAGGIAFLYQTGLAPDFLGITSPELFKTVSGAYLAIALLALPFPLWRRPHYSIQVLLLVLCDIAAITLIMHASGGPQTGLGMLLAVNVTLSCLMLGSVSSLVIASIATIAMLSEQTYAVANNLRDNRAYTQAALLGATYFALASLAVILARRLKESETAAAESRDSLAKLERLNEHIIQYMSAGVLVVDRANRLRLLNHAAWTQLGMPSGALNNLLDDVCVPLFKQLRQWRRSNDLKPQAFRISANTPELLPSFNGLGSDQQLTLIFLEDTSRTTQQATQMKLASLGRLTASIAHEIRNPLGALSHAAQLLRESPEIPSTDQRLVDIIEKNSGRMNKIIENIMQISQRRPSQPESIELSGFLLSFVDDFRVGRNPAPEIKVDVTPPDLRASFDVGQLIQVLTNLCDNGIRYSIRKVNRPVLEIHAGEDRRSGRPFIDVVDHGEGINPETAEKIFEPFFTTNAKGLGLGLYLARELCQANRAMLDFVPVPAGGSCFRVTFAATNKTIPTN